LLLDRFATQARAIFDRARQKKSGTMLFPENEMNLYGYELLQQGNTKDAIIVFEMNVEAFPASANTYDSLSDAYLAAGQRDKALTFAEKAIEALATDTTAPEAFKAAIRESAQRKINDLKK
jgi:tetratricopeptide (TPR) repeat protein